MEVKSSIRVIKDPDLEPYFIQLDDYCYAAHKTIIAQESGKEYSQALGFYKNLDTCLKAIAKDQVMARSYDSLKEYINEYRNIVSRLDKFGEL